jgi:nucleotide-binding universal stress UspA family protein
MPPSESTSRHLIVVGVDGSEPSDAAARWALEQARLTGSRLEVVTAWQSVGSWGMSWGVAVPIPTDYDPVADARTMLEPIVEELKRLAPTVAIDVKVVEGHPAEVLMEASRHADLLVVASRGHGEFAGMLIGSVSQHLATQAHCPVVIVREAEDRA